jgi:MarR family 2-MHQ and catechol resistance regulon transcriptional repressor
MAGESDTRGIHLWLVLMKAYKAMESVDLKSIHSLGMGGISDFSILEVLLHKGPQQVSQIGRRVGLTSGSITTAVDRVEKKGWVTRSADPSDRRVVTISLTREGHEKIAQEIEVHAAVLETMASVLTHSERETLLSLLEKIGFHAQTLVDEPIEKLISLSSNSLSS